MTDQEIICVECKIIFFSNKPFKNYNSFVCDNCKLNLKIGNRIKLIYTNDPYTELKKGDMGIITDINKIQISINWDSGSRLMMIPDLDIIEVV